MKESTDIFKQNKIFIKIALLTGFILLIPFLLMNFKVPLYDPGSGFEIINWNIFDFVVMATLLFGTGSLYVLVARKMKNHRLILGIVFLLVLLWLWAELAVGVFTNWGN